MNVLSRLQLITFFFCNIVVSSAVSENYTWSTNEFSDSDGVFTLTYAASGNITSLYGVKSSGGSVVIQGITYSNGMYTANIRASNGSSQFYTISEVCTVGGFGEPVCRSVKKLGPTINVNTPVPTVNITNPIDNKSAHPGESIFLSADAFVASGSIDRVIFKVNGKDVAEDTSAPYQQSWVPDTVGDYVITAEAIDNNADSTTSSSKKVNVNENSPPSISISTSLVDNTGYMGVELTINANATDDEGIVNYVKFYVNDELLQPADSVSPYNILWTPTQVGDYTFKAVAVDDDNAETLSSEITVSIIDLPPEHTESTVKAGVFDSARYDIYYGDLDDNGMQDIYFQGKEQIILIHNDIITPIVLSAPDSFVVYQRSIGYGAVQPLALAETELTNLTKAVENTDYYFADFNNDGHQDILVRGATIDDPAFILAGNSKEEFTQLLLEYSGENTLASHNLSDRNVEIVIEDGNADGRADLLLVQNEEKSFVVSNSLGMPSTYTTAPAPSVPTTLYVPENSDTGTFDVRWGQSRGIVDNYVLQERKSNYDGTWSEWETVEAQKVYVYEALNKDVGIYQYQLQVCNFSACSDFSTQVEIESHDLNGIRPEQVVVNADSVGVTEYGLNVDLDGNATIAVPITELPGVNGLKPQISIQYSSGRGIALDENEKPEDILGYGWNLSGFSEIRRCAKGPVGKDYVRLDTRDGLCLDDEPLILVSGTGFLPGATYRTYRESFLQVEIKGSFAEPWFEVSHSDGSVSEYGNTADSRVRSKTTQKTTKYFQWSINKVTDAFNNVMAYTYHNDELSGTNYPLSIQYDGASVEFAYLLRTDIEEVSFADIELGTLIQLHTIEIKMDDILVRDYRFMSEASQLGSRRLKHLQECGYGEAGAEPSCLQALEFEWSVDDTGGGTEYFSGVSRVTDSLGAVSEIDYGFIKQSAENSMVFTEEPFGKPVAPIDAEPLSADDGKPLRFVVTALHQDDGIDGFHTKNFAYAGTGFTSTSNWGFLGFYARRVTDVLTGMVTYYQQRLDAPYHGSIAAVHRYDDIYGSHSEIISRTESIYNNEPILHSSGDLTLVPYVKTRTNYLYENGVFLGADQETSSYQIINGFISELSINRQSAATVSNESSAATFWGDVSASTLSNVISTIETQSQFDNRITNGKWLIGFTESLNITQYDGAPGSEGVTSQSRIMAMSPYGSTMAVQSTTRYGGDEDNELTSTFGYDEFGNQTSVTVNGAYVSTRSSSAADFLHNRYPTTLKNALSHQTTVQGYDLRFGSAKEVKDSNLLTSSIERDPFGRVISRTTIDQVSSQRSFESCSFVICPVVEGVAPSFRVVSSSPISPSRIDYFDRLGRAVRTELEAFAGSDSIVKDTKYDQLGRVDYYSLPYRDGDAAQYVNRVYDSRHRVIQELRPDGGKTVIEYDPLADASGVSVTSSETVLKANGIDVAEILKKKSEFNVLGKLVKTTDAYGTSDAVSTSYQYNAQQLLKQAMVDGGGDGKTTSTMEYDAAGNRTKLIGPNIGTVLTRYNGLGQVRKITDNKQQESLYTYDVLGRLREKTTIDGTVNWVYDPQEAKGMLNYRTDNNGFTETYEYKDPNRVARLSGIKTQIDVEGYSKTFTRGFSYDTYGRMKDIVSPSGFSARSLYNDRGYLSSISDASSSRELQRFDEADAFGVTKETYGNDVITQRSFDQASGRVQLITTNNDSTSIQQLELQWRSNSTLESRISTHVGIEKKESFVYDALGRVEKAQTFIDQNPQRLLDYAYNRLGNLTSKTSDNAVDEKATDYRYGETINAGPHAVSSVTLNDVEHTLNYDQNGALTHYDAATGADKFIRYNAANQPVMITVGSAIDDASPEGRDEFKYGPDGQRYYKKSTYFDSNNNEQVEHTFYIGDYQEVELPAHQSTQRVKKTYVGTNILHIKTVPFIANATESIEYLHRDHLGSVESITDEAGELLQQMAFDPYGGRRNSDWLSAITSAEEQTLLETLNVRASKGFTGHEHLDRTGFIHMNGRVYDPLLGRFLSPDPLVQSVTNSQSFNRYSYVMNSPLSYVDPTGYEGVPFQAKDYTHEEVLVTAPRLSSPIGGGWSNGASMLTSGVSFGNEGASNQDGSGGSSGGSGKEETQEEKKVCNKDSKSACVKANNPWNTSSAKYQRAQIEAVKKFFSWLYKDVKFKVGVTGGHGLAGSAESSTNLKDLLDGKFDSELGLGIGGGLAVIATFDADWLKFSWGKLDFPVSVEVKGCAGSGFGTCVSAKFLGENYFQLHIKPGVVAGVAITSEIKHKTQIDI